MSSTMLSPLAAIEPRLRSVLPADLYALAWLDPTEATLTRVFEHLRTLQRILTDYVPRQITEALPNPGEIRYQWKESTLMFTDMAGFTHLMEANSAKGSEGAKVLLGVLNSYFAEMIEIISMSGGNLLEFTGDAMLAQFEPDKRQSDTAQAVRAALRMQRAMVRFKEIETSQGTFSLGMRVGIHAGRFLSADIGTPRRMEHVLLGTTVQRTKLAEGAGQVGRVNLTETAFERVKDQFHFEPGKPGHLLVVDDLSDEQLGEFDIAPASRRLRSPILFDRSIEGILGEVETSLRQVEQIACYLPNPILNLLVETAARRQIPPDLPNPTVLFVNLIGLPESVDEALPSEEIDLVSSFSRVFALINAAVETRGGVLKKVTYHVEGSDIVIYFGAPVAHTDDSIRAAETALAIRDVITNLTPPIVGGRQVKVTCQLGLNRGPAFAAEIGEPRGRREYNVLGDTVNTAARLMGKAVDNQIFMTENVYQQIAKRFKIKKLKPIALKGKAAPTAVYALLGPA